MEDRIADLSAGLNVEEGGRSIALDPTKSPIDSAYLSLFTPLSEEGRAQANILRKNVEKPDLVLLSQLPRTMETAREVYGAAVVETDESRGFFRFSDGTSVPYEKYEVRLSPSLSIL
jgi:broad specificity phosphatase PhoE